MQPLGQHVGDRMQVHVGDHAQLLVRQRTYGQGQAGVADSRDQGRVFQCAIAVVDAVDP